MTDEKDLGYIGVRELADALNGKNQSIQLPAFQRDAVWDEARISMLWDSLMRDYPIGTLLFARATGAVKQVTAAGEFGEISRSSSAEFIIIDGQQRSNSIAIGRRIWSEGDASRVWIDLGDFNEEEFSPDRFYVCTWREPWGREASGKKKASDGLKRQALSILGKERLSIKNGEYRRWLGYTWPLAASFPIPLAELFDWFLSGRPWSLDEFLDSHNLSGRIKGNPHQNQEAIVEDLLAILQKKIPFYVVDQRDSEELHLIFERLNTKGVQMSPQDLFFSALKVEWPEAHDLVWRIYQDPETGRFLSQTDIVHLAVRLVARTTKKDFLNLNPQSFKVFVRASDINGQPFIEGAKRYLGTSAGDDVGNVGRLHGLLRKARKAHEYNPDRYGLDDPGLPAPLLARVRPRVWHTLVAWFEHHDEIDEAERLEMLRYVLLDHFYAHGSASALQSEPFRLAFNASGRFPGFAIFLALQSRQLLNPQAILSPQEYKTLLFNGGKPEEPVWQILQNEREVVMWNQRKYLQDWFHNYDPMLYMSAALPYDVDHILPQAHMNMHGRVRWASGGPPTEFWRYRKAVGNGAGNIRYWPKDLNRADGSNNLTDKFVLGNAATDLPSDSYLVTRLELKTVADVRAASCMPEDEKLLRQWQTASPTEGSSYDWKEERGRTRILALREATKHRRLALYSALFEGVAWQTWIKDEAQMTLAGQIRHFVHTEYVAPARANNRPGLTLRAGDIHQELDLRNRVSAICRALDAQKFYEETAVTLVDRSGHLQGSAAEWTLEI